MTVQKPATPLPWRTALFKRADWHVVGGSEPADDYQRAAICKREDDSAYIAHTANAYPELVEALRTAELWLRIAEGYMPTQAVDQRMPNGEALRVRPACDVVHEVHEQAAELLRKLGEPT